MEGSSWQQPRQDNVSLFLPFLHSSHDSSSTRWIPEEDRRHSNPPAVGPPSSDLSSYLKGLLGIPNTTAAKTGDGSLVASTTVDLLLPNRHAATEVLHSPTFRTDGSLQGERTSRPCERRWSYRDSSYDSDSSTSTTDSAQPRRGNRGKGRWGGSPCSVDFPLLVCSIPSFGDPSVPTDRTFAIPAYMRSPEPDAVPLVRFSEVEV